jgi:hypothetical protein
MNPLMYLRINFILAALSISSIASQGIFIEATRAESIDFNRDIRPLLADNCFSCHGPDSASRKAELRLDNRQAAIDSGAIEPSNPKASGMLARIFSDDPEMVMPIPESHKVLLPEQKDLLKRWIESGAEYQSHWSFAPPQRHDFPEVRNTGWVRNPIDRFILSKLESSGLEPSAEADIRTLVRRVSLDLTGLPPTAAEVEAVVADPAPDRYERFVEDLLSRPTWGEHRGRYWLDYARYADSHGIHFDNYREMYSFRDWVINAFNSNMPFDQFTIEQLAGDLLPEPTLDQQIASGFNRCNITTSEGGAISEEYQVLYTRDRVETTSAIWLGLTTGCAVCHDHKFDPISQREFYELAAYFNNLNQTVMDGNRKDTPPIVVVPQKSERERYKELVASVASAQKSMQDRRVAAKSEFDSWKDNLQSNAQTILAPLRALARPVFQAPFTDNQPNTLAYVFEGEQYRLPLTKPAKLAPGYIADQAWTVEAKSNPSFAEVGKFERNQPFTITTWVKLGSKNQTGALVARMDEDNSFRGWDLWVEKGRIGMHIANRFPENSLKVVSDKPIPADKWHHVAVSYDGSSKAEGVKVIVDGSEVKVSISNNTLSETIQTETPLKIGSRSKASNTNGAILQDIRIYNSALSVSDIDTIRSVNRLVYLVSKPAKSRSEKETDEVFTWYLRTQDSETIALTKSLSTLESEQKQIESRGTIAHVMSEKQETAKAFVLLRGDYDKRGEEVGAQTPAVLLPMEPELPKNRLGLAKWLVNPKHPLTARVTVNRFWQELFGLGLVGSSGDFGVTGETPTHPQLLDFLAIQFVEKHWDVKDLFRTMVTSATYRQSAVMTDQKKLADPTNRLYSRGPRFRMDAEMVRDYGLAAGGLLVKEIGGPSVRPYQPIGVWEAVAMPNSDTRIYKEDSGEKLYRRSMYTFWKRSAPPASMEIFNAPSREQCTVRRERTNTPLQALVTLNDPQLVEAARAMAQRILLAKNGEKEQDDAQKVQAIGMLLLGRSWIGEEQSVILASLEDLRKHYAASPSDAEALLAVGNMPREKAIPAAEHAAWTMLCNQLLNLDEVLCK